MTKWYKYKIRKLELFIMDKKFPSLAFLSIIVMYFILAQFSLFICDDYRYAFIQGTGIPIDNLRDAVISQSDAYMHENGRFLVHVIVQYIAGVLNMEWLAVFNTFMFAVLVYFLYRLMDTPSSRCNPIALMLSAIIMLILFMPNFGNVFISNIAMSVNYLWTTAASLAFIYIVGHSCRDNKSRLAMIWFSFFAFIAGCMQESFCIGIGAGLVAYGIWNRREVTKQQLIVSLFYCVGAAIVVLAPSNFLRVNAVNGDVNFFVKCISNLYHLVLHATLFDLFVIMMCWMLLTDTRACLAFLKSNSLLWVAALVNASFVVFVAFTGAHQLVCIEVMSLILITRFLIERGILPRILNGKYTLMSLVIILLIMVIPALYYRHKVCHAYHAMVSSARNSTNGIVIGGEYDRLSYEKRNWYMNHFCTTELYADSPLWSFSKYLTNGENEKFISARLPIPQEQIVALTIDNPIMLGDVQIKHDAFFYIIKSPMKLESITVTYQSFMTSLKEKLFGGHADGVSVIKMPKVAHVIKDEAYYYVVYEDQSHPFQIVDYSMASLFDTSIE